ncbi:hypothetical protein ACCS54_15905 [Rhizobium johnstonii]|uniref:hypothetical protein n=1 Tax=Rhizobium TaxID=379 RepID=UPI0003252922|nr:MULTISPECIES: hypothetical protein [Rhizobium]MBY5373334.1 hypothetical protein [Rhizobium leguminosarum]MBY5388323.1 hypothetical protein [Rhizobium leguminosarum]MBY5415249.1 hypothetical protein [Rhizobium leguminosarum]MBY5428915.1 hypothetical protein [Rhizobium leguminosarum]NEH97832.1 hypothetical protein [Rhizobium leguminosarum]
MTDPRRIGKGQAAADHIERRPFIRFVAYFLGFSNTRKKEKIPVDNGTYMEQIENITSKGEPDD